MDCTSIDTARLHADLAQLLDYCTKLAGTADVPAWSDFRPSAVPRLMAALYVAEPVNDGAGGVNDYRYRSYGALLPEYFGDDLRGKLLSDARGDDFRHAIVEVYDAVLACRRPHALWVELYWPDGGSYQTGHLLIPFTDANRAATILLGAVVSDVPRENLVLFRGKGMARMRGWGPPVP
ncbi:MAG: PAS domain-containing protein [Rhizomicrobium sp.]